MRIESRRAEREPVESTGEPIFFAAGAPAQGEFHCAECGYGIAVRTVLPVCPMCRGRAWEGPSTSPHGRRTH